MKIIITFILTLFTITKADELQINLGKDTCLSNDNGEAISCDASNTWFIFEGATSTLCSKDGVCITIEGQLSYTQQPAKFSRENSMLVSESGTTCIATNGRKLIKLKTCSLKPIPSEIDGSGYLKISENECILGNKIGGPIKIGKCDNDNIWEMDNFHRIHHEKTNGCLEVDDKRILLADCGMASSWKLSLKNMRNLSEKKCLYRDPNRSRFYIQKCIRNLKFNLSQIKPTTTEAPATEASATTAKPDDGVIEISLNNHLGHVTTTRNWTLEFSIKFKSMPTGQRSVLHIGNGQWDRHPQIMLMPHSTRAWFLLKGTECNKMQKSGTSSPALGPQSFYISAETNQYYDIKIVAKEYSEQENTNQVNVYVDGVDIMKTYLTVCADYKANVYVGSKWLAPAPAYIKDLKYNGEAISTDA